MSENNNLICKAHENTTCIKKIINWCCKKQIKTRSFQQTNSIDEEDHRILLSKNYNLTENLLTDSEALNNQHELHNDIKINTEKMTNQPESFFFKDPVILGLPSDGNLIIIQKPEGNTLFASGLEEQVLATERSEEKQVSTQRSEEPLLFNQISEEKLLDTQSLVVESLRRSSLGSSSEDYFEQFVTSYHRKRYQLKHNGFKVDDNAFQSNFKTEWKKDRIFAMAGKTWEDENLYEYSINYRKIVYIYSSDAKCSMMPKKSSDNKSIFLNYGFSKKILQLNARSLKLITKFGTKKEPEASLITHDKKFLFVFQKRFNLQKFSIDTGKLLYEYKEKSGLYFEFSFCSLDNKYLLIPMENLNIEAEESNSEDDQDFGVLGIFDIQNDRMVKKLKVGKFFTIVCGVAFKKNNEHAYLSDQYQNVYMLNMKTFDISQIFESRLEKMIYGSGYSNDNSMNGSEDMPHGINLIREERSLLLCAADRSIVIDLEKKEIIKKFNFFKYRHVFEVFDRNQRVELINDGKIACIIHNYGDIVIIDLETQEIIDYHGDFLNGEQIRQSALMQN